MPMLGASTYLAPGPTFRSSEKRSKKTQCSVRGHGEQNSSSPTATTRPSEPSARKQAWPQQHSSTGTGMPGPGHWDTPEAAQQKAVPAALQPLHKASSTGLLRVGAQLRPQPRAATEPCTAAPQQHEEGRVCHSGGRASCTPPPCSQPTAVLPAG